MEKKELFEVSCHVYDEGNDNVSFNVTWKENGKQTEIKLMDDDRLYIAAKGMEYAAGFFARAYIDRQHKAGKISDEKYEAIKEGKVKDD